VRTHDVDFTLEAARRFNCGEELRLNRRLSDDIYLDIVPLLLDASGRLRLAGDGRAIDWLVKMRRLPASRMLDRLIVSGLATSQDVQRVVTRLALLPRQRTGAGGRRRLPRGVRPGNR
jgi:aminoglycoside phosphotransferase family enzyme